LAWIHQTFLGNKAKTYSVLVLTGFRKRSVTSGGSSNIIGRELRSSLKTTKLALMGFETLAESSCLFGTKNHPKQSLS
jgi:hypothetical protein